MGYRSFAIYLKALVFVSVSTSIYAMQGTALFQSLNSDKNEVLSEQNNHEMEVSVQTFDSTDLKHTNVLQNIPAPRFLSPANNSILTQSSFLVTWEAVPNAKQYTIQASKSSTFNPIIGNFQEKSTQVKMNLSGQELVDGDNIFYQRVNATTDAGTSQWSETLKITYRKGQSVAPAAPKLVSPQNFAVNQPIALTLSWQASSGATSYAIQVSTATDFKTGTVVCDQKNISTTSTPIENLQHGQNYYWHVSAQNSGGVSNWSTVYKFSTVHIAPQPPKLVQPADNASTVPLSTSVSWKSVSGAESYTLQVSNTNTFTQILINKDTLKDSSFILNALSPNTIYFWRVQAVNSGGTSGWSSVWKFTTGVDVQNIPKLLKPQDGSLEEPLNLVLSWNSISSSGAAYTVQVSNSPSFTSLLVNVAALTTTTYQVSNGLSPNTQYYWRVCATVQSVTSNWSDSWSFKTVVGNITKPQLVAPPQGSNNNPLSLTFVWSSGSTPYTFQIARSKDFNTNSIVLSNNSLTSPTITIHELIKNSTYFWRVGSSLPNSTTPLWSEIWSFITTSSDSITIPSLVSPLNTSTNHPLTVIFTWNPTVNAHKYLIHVSTTTDFASDKLVAANGTLISPTFTVDALQKSCVYYWRVCTIDSTGNAGTWSQVWSFTTTGTVEPLPEKPSLMYPLDNTIHVALNLTMVWNGTSNVTSYTMQIARSKDFAQGTVVFDSSAITSTYFEIKNLALNTVYYWRVRGINSTGAGSWSEVWSFLTQKITGIIKNPEDKNPPILFVASTPIAKSDNSHIEFKCAPPQPMSGSLIVYDYLGHSIYRTNVHVPKKTQFLTRCAVWNVCDTKGHRVCLGTYTVLLRLYDSKGIHYYGTCMIGVQE